MSVLHVNCSDFSYSLSCYRLKDFSHFKAKFAMILLICYHDYLTALLSMTCTELEMHQDKPDAFV